MAEIIRLSRSNSGTATVPRCTVHPRYLLHNLRQLPSSDPIHSPLPVSANMEVAQNANPTIINPSDLPTRRRKQPQDSEKAPGLDIFSDLSTEEGNDPFKKYQSESESDDEVEPIDEQEIYDLISTMSDPEHPISLGSLGVVSLPDISIRPTIPNKPESPLRTVTVLITPTITHCSLATVIGLGVRVRLEESLPPRFRVDVKIKEGTHTTAEEVNKQLADKERVAAALWNTALQSFIKKMLETCQ